MAPTTHTLAPGIVARVPQQDRDAADPFEDGFAAMLTDASWARVREGFAAATNVEVPATSGGSSALRVEWVDPAHAGRTN